MARIGERDPWRWGQGCSEASPHLSSDGPACPVFDHCVSNWFFGFQLQLPLGCSGQWTRPSLTVRPLSADAEASSDRGAGETPWRRSICSPELGSLRAQLPAAPSPPSLRPPQTLPSGELSLKPPGLHFQPVLQVQSSESFSATQWAPQAPSLVRSGSPCLVLPSPRGGAARLLSLRALTSHVPPPPFSSALS